jgi:hypothetical protein
MERLFWLCKCGVTVICELYVGDDLSMLLQWELCSWFNTRSSEFLDLTVNSR